MKTKIVFFLIDGISDEPSDDTPLKNSKKPFLDYLNKENKIFLSCIFPLKKEYWPKIGETSVSGLANLGILGYKIKPEIFKRGPYEALGANIKYKNGWLAFRANFATVDEKLKVLDRRAGRNILGLEKLEREINKIRFEIPFIFKRTSGHRGVLVFKKKLSDKITFNDPLANNKKVKIIEPEVNQKLAIYTAKIVNEFLEKVYIVLKDNEVNLEREKKNIPPANYLLLREGGTKILNLNNFFKKYGFKNGITLATLGVDLGTCISVGFKKLILKEAKNIKEEFKIVYESFRNVFNKYELIYVHLKKADEASHDRNYLKKKEFFEEFDKFFKKIYKENIIFVITGDHITSVKKGKHMFGAVPLIIANSSFKNKPKEISEKQALKMGIYFKENSQLWKFLKNDSEKN